MVEVDSLMKVKEKINEHNKEWGDRCIDNEIISML